MLDEGDKQNPFVKIHFQLKIENNFIIYFVCRVFAMIPLIKIHFQLEIENNFSSYFVCRVFAIFENSSILTTEQEPWSNSDGRRLTSKRPWVLNLILDGHFLIYCCKNCIVCLNRPKVNYKRSRR